MDIANMTRSQVREYAANEARRKSKEYDLPFAEAYRRYLDANPALKQAAYGPAKERVATTDPADQARGAARHVDQQAASFLRQARKSGKPLTYAQAIKAAVAQSPVLAARAGVHKDLLPAKTHAKPNEWQARLKAVTEAEMIEQLTTIPAKGELMNWIGVVREWARLQLPPPPAGQAVSGPDASNALVQRVLDAALAARQRKRGFQYKDEKVARKYAVVQAASPWRTLLPQLSRQQVVDLVGRDRLGEEDIVEWVTTVALGGKKPFGSPPPRPGQPSWEDRLQAEVAAIERDAEIERLAIKGRTL